MMFVIPVTAFILSMVVLAFPLLTLNADNFPSITKTAVKTAFFISTIPLIWLVNDNMQLLLLSWEWFNIVSTPIHLTIRLDLYSIIFIPIALMVSWSIVEFSLWYMQHDMMIGLFFKYLLIFLLTMMLLVSASNLVALFIGWEGVGIMSYLLIGWYFARSNAGVAALQAVLYNRIGDLGFMYAMFWLMTSYNSIDLNFNFSMTPPTFILIALIVSAASKSAQFGLHPWLASAMEGPTPVSALLHSSTMVVAGVFLLTRIHPMIENNQTALTTCLCLGAITTAFAATCALNQNDIKKIIAYSTSSQLGLMMVAIGLNMPHLAFFHICTHAFFKAMLFLCSGSIIHSLAGEQDIRKMGGLHKSLPFTTSCISLGSLALMGTPYLTGFYSKDAIIEAVNTSHVNALALVLTIIATSFSAVYSLRMIYYASLAYPRYSVVIPIDENQPKITNPLTRLALGSIMAGLMISQIILPSSPMTMTMPVYMKIMALMASILGFMIALYMARTSWVKPPKNLYLPEPSSIYSIIIHRLISSITMHFSQRIPFKLFDASWLEKLGPKGMPKLQLPLVKMFQEAQNALIKVYLTFFLLSVIFCITILLFV